MDERETFLGEQASDEDVYGKFDKLMSEIRTWSSHFNGGNADSFKEDRFSEYQNIVPLYTELRDLDEITTKKRKKRLFVRGWTAYVICTKLFRTLDLAPAGDLGNDVWLGNALADNFRCLENQLWLTDRKVVSYKSFNDWRAFTAELLGRATSTQGEKPTDQVRAAVANAVSEVLEVVTVWHKTGAAEDLEADKNELHRIFIDAVQFSQLLRRQRALWSIRFPSRPEAGSLRFNPMFMFDPRDEDEDDMEELRKCYVELIATPILYKRGTMNGEWFESEEAVRLAEIVMMKPN
ncbi:hypothetical protein BU25DRAFT_460707 [Macroventuria anomochaeta]|uniref:Uncharacterized protein n=1 Tax=Macroventuria anomochaeta TaxID=301207 RepID=A0ACB6RTX8_9PLEO|nr:uncharacterized protein BU25DRAFT_460707 [Macroventuria anomochaeta]KAF2624865.1 hypothetical protein BU25DRAFT_460707 [Macroventuria anomochaeta]